MTTPSRDLSPPPTKRRRISPASSLLTPSRLAPSLPSRRITSLRANTLRIFTWNINSIAPFLQPTITSFFAHPHRKASRTPSSDRSNQSTSPSLQACLKRWKYPHVVCLQEVKIACHDTRSQQAVRQAVKSPTSSSNGEPGYTVHFALPRDKYNARGFGGKIYGVCTLVRDDVLIRKGGSKEDCVREVQWDTEGRVLVLEMPERKMVVFNVYAVNGTENPWRDPQTGEIIGSRHDRKRLFHRDLHRECESYLKEQAWSVVIAGDLNIARSSLDGWPRQRMGAAHVLNRKDFESHFMKREDEGGLAMIDTFRELHGEERKYTYRSRGQEWGLSCDRVDMILIRATSECNGRSKLIEADILDDELERGPSDHVPLYITVELDSKCSNVES